MKKFVFKIFALIVSLLICCPQNFALGHTLSKRSHVAFVNQLRGIINNFIKENEANLRIKSDLEICHFVDSFSTHNDAFDLENGITRDGTTSFGEALSLCHAHISDPKILAKEPMCCRGLAMYVLQELINKKIDCRYIKLSFTNQCGATSPHDAVAYKAPGGWYICDLGKAMAYSIALRFIKDDDILSKIKQDLREQSPDYLLKIPLAKYKRWYSVVRCSLKYDFPRICKNSWVELEPSPELLLMPAVSVLDHFENMTEEEIWNFYRVHTLEEFFMLSSEEKIRRVDLFFSSTK